MHQETIRLIFFIVHHTKIESLISLLAMIEFLPMPEYMRHNKIPDADKKES
jgi:hypothetical protein